MTTFHMHLDDKAVTARRVVGLAEPTIRVCDGRSGYLTLFLTKRSVELLAAALEECKRQDITEVEVPRVAANSKR